ncbi:MAG: nucleotidyltransferase domain-containing protein [Planctomycetaceae bacterium]|nr:nucleotidyltransferase domain-containing protein [Planctomycetaceae bacterium]
MTIPQEFATQVCRALPTQIRSVVLFGSAASGDFIPGVSRYDLLVLVDQLGMDELEALAPAIRAWRQGGNPLPLLFTPAQFAASADAFAIEYLDMQHDRKLLYGTDPIPGVKVSEAQARMHLERELRGKSLALRDQYVLAAGDARHIVDLLCDSLSSFLSLFRVALRLYQPQTPSHKVDALHALAAHIPFDPQPFVSVEEIKELRRSPHRVDARALFHAYWQGVETVTDAVDRLLHPSH